MTNDGTPWRNIDSAPKDGTRVVYLSPTYGIWIGNEPPGRARGEWRQSKTGDWHGAFCAGRYPSDETHWQPVPECLATLPESYRKE